MLFPRVLAQRLNAPHKWMLSKLGGIFAPKPSSGPHKERECMPLVVILRNRLKYALTRAEAQSICMQKLVQVDGRVRTDMNFPTGFMDVVHIPKSKDSFRLLYDTKGRFVLHSVEGEEANFKLCRVVRVDVTKKGIPVAVTHDGRTIRYPDPDVKPLDTIKVDLKTGKAVGHVKFDTGCLVMTTKGRNSGRIGELVHRDRHPGAFDIVHVRDARGHTFATRLHNVFVIGATNNPDKALISLPRGKGIKFSIIEQREHASRA